MPRIFNASDLPIVDGKIYHLNLCAEDLADKIIIVGDPDRVPRIASQHLKNIRCDVFHRGLRTITGEHIDSGTRLSITTSGMGGPSTEIVLNEIHILKSVDLSSRRALADPKKVAIVRVGSSGGVHSDVQLGDAFVSEYAVGLDNSGLFYDVPLREKELRVVEERVSCAINSATPSTARFAGRIHPFAAKASPQLTLALMDSAKKLNKRCFCGITVSNAGFFAAQGRDVSGISPTLNDIDQALAGLGEVLPGLRITNFEMEAALLLHFMGGNGHFAATICAAIANRALNTFTKDAAADVDSATEIAIAALVRF